MSESSKKPTTQTTEAVPAEENLDTIKEILVGDYTHEVHKRMDALEARVTREAKAAQDATNRMLDLLESYMKKEVEVLHSELKTEKADRFEAQKIAMSELDGREKSWDKKVTQISDQTAERFHEVRDQVGGHFKTLSETIARSQQTLRKEMDLALDSLESRKTDRRFLSALLLQMAGALQKNSRGLKEVVNEGVKRSA